MRIASSGYIDTIKRSLSHATKRIDLLYAQLSSSKRLRQLSDDPLAAAQCVRFHAAVKELQARKEVAQQAKQCLGATDTALNEISQNLLQAYQAALRGQQSVLTDTERQALATELRSLSQRLVTVGNTEIMGRYIFAGSLTDTKPFVRSEQANLPVLYQGNHVGLAYHITPEECVQASLTGAKVFNFPDALGQRPLPEIPQDTFSLLEKTAQVLERGDLAALESCLEDLKRVHAYVVGLRGQVGIQSQRCERALQAIEGVDLQLREMLTEKESVDFATALVELNTQQTIYQAALAATSRLLSIPGLFDYWD